MTNKSKPPRKAGQKRASSQPSANQNSGGAKPQRRKTGYPARPVVAYPKALWEEWEDPPTFSQALDLHMRRHGDTGYGLRRAVCERGETIETTTFTAWRRGAKAPRGAASLRILAALERRWKLPPGYFRDKLPHPGRYITTEACLPLPMSERRRMAWHLPDDFAQLPLPKRQEIEAWVRSVILSGHTDYRRYQAEAMKQRFAFQFSGQGGVIELSAGLPLEDRLGDPGLRRIGRPLGAAPAPAQLDEEAGDLLAFKTATLTSRGRRRNGVWNSETAAQKMEHLGLAPGHPAVWDLQSLHGPRRHRGPAAAWTTQCPRRPGDARAQADRLLRAGKLCDPGHAGHDRGALRPLPATGQGGPGRPSPQSGVELAVGNCPYVASCAAKAGIIGHIRTVGSRGAASVTSPLAPSRLDSTELQMRTIREHLEPSHD